jgi:TldD protein
MNAAIATEDARGNVLAPESTPSRFLAHFDLTAGILSRTINTALSRGAEYCDLYFEHKISNYLSSEDHAVNRAFARTDFGVGIRAVRNDQIGYSYTEEITPRAMESAARTAANIADSAGSRRSARFRTPPSRCYYQAKEPWESVPVDRKMPLLASIREAVYALEPRVVHCDVQMNDEVRYLLIARSDGRLCTDVQPMTTIQTTVVVEKNGRREEGSFSVSGRRGFECYQPEVLNRLASEPVRRAVVLFEAGAPPAGEMEVVLAPGGSGVLLHEAIGHGLEADFNRKGQSAFAGRIGEAVASELVSVVDDGTIPDLRGTINIDDEGNAPERTMLVENGILLGYLHDRISAAHYGVEPTGNGRRESFRHPPIPRMRNTYMLPGPHHPKDIIGSVKNGMYAEEFANGEVFIGSGDFSFSVKLGYLIQGGRLTRPVKNVNIIGNGPQVLNAISMVGNDLRHSEDGATCSKDGQGVPVQMGLPTVKISSLTVGGTNSPRR